MTTEPRSDERQTLRQRLAAILMLLAGGLTVVLRLVPHRANFLPIGALGIFGGAKQRGWTPFLLPLAVMVVSDVGLWIISDFNPLYLFDSSRVYVYASVLAYVGIGRLIRNRVSPLTLCGASLLGSIQFFVVTNFCTWLFQPWQPMEGVPAAFIYSRDWAGLMTCFAAGLPFFQADSPLQLHAILVGDPKYSAIYLVVGDLLFTFGLFVAHGAMVRVASPAEASRPEVQTTPE